MTNWEDVGHDIEAWFVKEKGNTLIGKFVGFVEMETKFGDKVALLFETEKPCQGVKVGSDEDAEPEEIPKGHCVAMFKSGGLRAFESIRVGTRVAIKVTGEKDTGKGNPMTTFSVKRDKACLGSGECAPAEAEPKRKQHRNRRARDDESYTPPPSDAYQDESDDDIPF